MGSGRAGAVLTSFDPSRGSRAGRSRISHPGGTSTVVLHSSMSAGPATVCPTARTSRSKTGVSRTTPPDRTGRDVRGDPVSVRVQAGHRGRSTAADPRQRAVTTSTGWSSAPCPYRRRCRSPNRPDARRTSSSPGSNQVASTSTDTVCSCPAKRISRLNPTATSVRENPYAARSARTFARSVSRSRTMSVAAAVSRARTRVSDASSR